MKKLNRNNANIKKILNKKVAIVCDSKEKELDFRKWAKQYVDCVDEDYVYTNCGNGICIKLDYGGLKWDYIKYFLEDNYSIYEWEIAEVIKSETDGTVTIPLKRYLELLRIEQGGIKMEKLNRNNADIEKLRDKKVAVRLVGKDAEIDFRKWLEGNGIHFNNKEVLLIRNGIRTEICYCVEGNSWDWCDEKWFIEKGYTLYEWEVAEEQKTYTIKDVVENEGKIYQSITNNCIYKYYKHYLYYKSMRKLSDGWRKTELTLGEILELEFIEYKLEPKEITFEEALKEMETKVCGCLFSDRFITIYGSQFVDARNGEDTNLSLSEIQSEWIVVNE